MKRLTRLLIRFAELRGRVQLIGDSTPVTYSTVYMVRYVVFRSRWFALYVHQFLRSDKDSYHDHPWNFWSYVVQGDYIEHTPRETVLIPPSMTKFGQQQRVPYFQTRDMETYRGVWNNRLAYRHAEDLHWVELERPYTYSARASAPTTICLIGRRRRAWGFINKDCRWEYWRSYLGLPMDGSDPLAPTGGQKVKP